MRPHDRPRLARHAKLRFDAARQAWVLLGPETVLMPDEIAVTVLQRCDGTATVAEVADALARDYEADREEVEGDVLDLLRDLAAKGLLDR